MMVGEAVSNILCSVYKNILKNTILFAKHS